MFQSLIAAEEGAMEKASKVSKAMAKINKTMEKVDSRLGLVESRSQANVAESSVNSNRASVTNATRIEQLATDVARVQLAVSELRDRQQQLQDSSSSSRAGFDLNATTTGDWFKNKFNAHLKSPESRSYLKDVAESKIRATQVRFSSIFLVFMRHLITNCDLQSYSV